MNKIFIEAQKPETAECCFLKAILSQYYPDKEVLFVCMNGVGNLFNETNVNLIQQANEDGDNVLVILDADNPQKSNAGYSARSKFVEEEEEKQNLSFDYFLYPNNADDGDVETLMESLARKDLHTQWWDCFGDYETCIEGIIDEKGNKRYNLPNLKAKLHTYISSQMLTSGQRKKISWNWLFDDKLFWDLSREELKPLIEFFRQNLK